MKLTIVISTLCLLFLPLLGRADDADRAVTQLKSERYQLIQLNAEVNDGKGNNHDIKNVIKIDSLTGSTWELVSSPDNDKDYSWIPLHENEISNGK